MSGWDMPTQHLCHLDHILGALWGKLIHSWENCHTNGPDTAPGCCHLNHHTLLSTWTTLYPWSCKANLTQCAKLAFINRPRGPCLSANKWILINNPMTCTALSQQTSALRLSQWLPAWQKHQQPPKNWMKGKTSKRKGWGTVSFPDTAFDTVHPWGSTQRGFEFLPVLYAVKLQLSCFGVAKSCLS